MLVTGGWDGVSKGLDSTEILHTDDAGVHFFFQLSSLGLRLNSKLKICYFFRLETHFWVTSSGPLGAKSGQSGPGAPHIW